MNWIYVSINFLFFSLGIRPWGKQYTLLSDRLNLFAVSRIIKGLFFWQPMIGIIQTWILQFTYSSIWINSISNPLAQSKKAIMVGDILKNPLMNAFYFNIKLYYWRVADRNDDCWYHKWSYNLIFPRLYLQRFTIDIVWGQLIVVINQCEAFWFWNDSIRFLVKLD